MRFLTVAIAVMMFSFFTPPASAVITDDQSLIEGAKLCTSYLPRHEREYGIPVHLLAAIASTESGRYNRELGMSLPWPWTINVEGKGYFFDTKEQAVAAVRALQGRGFQSIDVGCMQVNLHHHPNAFSSLEQAFDPAYNVAYAAQFLKHNYEDEGSWHKAVADYHSHTPFFGEQYVHLVFNSWGRIINKVADAQSGNLALKTNAALTAPVTLPPDLNNLKAPHRHMYHALHMHSISVSHDTTRENGVLVIRPERNQIAVEPKNVDAGFVTQAVKQAEQKPAAPDHKDAELIKVQSGNAVTKGQFEATSPRVITVNDSSTSTKPAKQDSVFVFDN